MCMEKPNASPCSFSLDVKETTLCTALSETNQEINLKHITEAYALKVLSELIF